MFLRFFYSFLRIQFIQVYWEIQVTSFIERKREDNKNQAFTIYSYKFKCDKQVAVKSRRQTIISQNKPNKQISLTGVKNKNCHAFINSRLGKTSYGINPLSAMNICAFRELRLCFSYCYDCRGFNDQLNPHPCLRTICLSLY